MVAVGQEFAFPIDFSSGKHAELYSAPGSVKSYAKQLAERLLSCRMIADLLVREQQCWHRELVNSRRPDPCTYEVGDFVFARRATRSCTVIGHGIGGKYIPIMARLAEARHWSKRRQTCLSSPDLTAIHNK
jgi:hypothetical protein